MLGKNDVKSNLQPINSWTTEVFAYCNSYVHLTKFGLLIIKMTLKMSCSEQLCLNLFGTFRITLLVTLSVALDKAVLCIPDMPGRSLVLLHQQNVIDMAG